ncbi:SH3 domain-containing protein [Bartonella sp. DGB2]|uniref:SH3 domain-containing protein n=1 Tax=Bartonella sp. DGB2 TaxID=3388426 RepID=UPI003990088E
MADIKPAFAQAIGESGLALPRFVSIKASRANVRVGPGRNYEVLFFYQKQGLPVEITHEYDQWRKIRDSDGAEGWILQSLLSNRRTALVAPWQKDKDSLIPLRKKSDLMSPIIAQLEPGVLVTVRSCDGTMCDVVVDTIRGFIIETQLWGVYPGEIVKR